MPVQRLEIPPSYSFSGNPIRFKVSGDNYLLQAGACASIDLQFTGIDQTVGHHFSLTFMGMTIQFTSVVTISWSGIEIQPAQSFNTPESWGILTSGWMALNYYLSKYYTLSFDNTHCILTITAKNVGSQYTITFDHENILGISAIHSDVGVDQVLRQGYGILMIVVDYLGNNFWGEDLKSVDNDGIAYFDCSEYVKAKLENISFPRFKFPEGYGDGYHDAVKTIHVDFAEKYDGLVKAMSTNAIPFSLYEGYVVPGGLSYEALAYWNSISESWWDDAVNELRYLSWHPGEKLTGKTNQESIYYLIKTPATEEEFELSKHLKIYYQDGSFEDYDLPMTSNVSNLVVELQCGYDYLDIDDIAGDRKVIKYEIWLKTSLTVTHAHPAHPTYTVVEYKKFTFRMDNNYQEFERNFKFRNSFGFYDNFRCTGKVEYPPNYDRDKIVTISEQKEDFLNPPVKNVNTLETQTFKATSGWITKDHLNYLRDFMRSEEIYEIIGDQLYPVVLTTKKMNSVKDGVYNLNLEFEYERAYSDQYYSKL